MSSAVQLLNQNLSGAKTQQNQENAKNIISDLINLLIEGKQMETPMNLKKTSVC